MRKFILCLCFSFVIIINLAAQSGSNNHFDDVYWSRSQVESIRSKRENYNDIKPATAISNEGKGIGYDDNTMDKFRFALGGGYTIRLCEREEFSDPVLDQLSKDLMHGYSIDGDMQYFVDPMIGFGININYVRTSASNDTRNYGYYGRKYEQSQTFLHIAPSFVFRSDVDQYLLICNIGIGPLFYTERAISSEKFSATCFGFSSAISAEYKVNQNWGIGLKLSYIVGAIGSLKDEGGHKIDLEDGVTVSNLNLGAFVSFRSR